MTNLIIESPEAHDRHQYGEHIQHTFHIKDLLLIDRCLGSLDPMANVLIVRMVAVFDGMSNDLGNLHVNSLASLLHKVERSSKDKEDCCKDEQSCRNGKCWTWSIELIDYKFVKVC